jgi:hypothetical protein
MPERQKMQHQQSQNIACRKTAWAFEKVQTDPERFPVKSFIFSANFYP